MLRTLIFILFVVSLSTFAQETMQTTLSECQKQAREHHPFAGMNANIENITGLKQKNANNQWLPQLNLNAQATYQSDALEINMVAPDFTTQPPTFNQKSIITPKDQYKATIDINQMLYDGGSVKAMRNVNDANAKAELLQNDAELQKTDDQITTVYFNILLLNDRIKLLESLRNSLEERKKSVESGLKNGILQQSDLDNMIIELLKNQQQIDESLINKKYLLANLFELTGITYSENVELQVPLIEITDSVSFQRPELLSLEAQQSGINSNTGLIKTQRMPKVYAFAQAGYGNPGLNPMKDEFDNFYIVGVSLKWNIWDWNKNKRDRQVLMIQNDMLQERRNALEQGFTIQLNNSRNLIEQLQKALETDRQIVALRKEVTMRSATKLDNGVITASDYINDQNAETQAQIQLQTHELQLIREKVFFLMIQGKR